MQKYFWESITRIFIMISIIFTIQDQLQNHKNTIFVWKAGSRSSRRHIRDINGRTEYNSM